MKKLATVEKISEVIPHPNADRLTIYKLEGLSWRVISAEKFEVGDLVVYIQVDTVMPEGMPEFEFLRKNHFRVNCIRLRGEYSNGLILPLHVLRDGTYHHRDDVTEILSVQKYEKPVSYNSGETAGSFPSHLIPKTDEDRIENFPELIEEFRNEHVYVSVKHDGSSVSIIHHNEDEGFCVCSRNLKIRESENSKYWQPVFSYDLKNKLPVGYAIQGELVGEGIQGNREGIRGIDIRVFHVWHLEDRRLLDYEEMKEFCEKLGIPTVDLYYSGPFSPEWNTVEDMIEEAKNARYQNGAVAEGLVWKLAINEYSDKLQKGLSVKTINYDYKD
jgi:RNA ligase (TIGR02306 family)